VSAAPLLATFDFPERPRWTARVVATTRPGRARRVGAVVRAARRHPALIVDGSIGPGEAYADLVAAVLVRRRPGPSPAVLVAECTWSAGGSARARSARRAAVRALDGPRVGYCVLSSAERARFAGLWGVDDDRVVFTPYCYTFDERQLDPPEALGNGIFAGGNSLRDYGPLLDVAPALGTRMTLATTRIPADRQARLPADVTAGPVPHERFVELTRSARVVVLALDDRDDRSAGQQGYLNAMALGRVVVVPDVMGVRDYVDDGRTGLVVPPGDREALARTLSWALDPQNDERMRELGRAAAEDVRRRFSPERYADALLAATDALVARAG
jgi:glycosyltransferase involved in cell wall biosynthesis